MADRPRILILDASVAIDSNLTPTYLGRWSSRLDYDEIISYDQLKQWRTLPRISHQLLIIAPLPWQWPIPSTTHLIEEIVAKYAGPVIVVCNFGGWTLPLKKIGCHIAKGPAMVPPLLSHLLFGEPPPSA